MPKMLYKQGVQPVDVDCTTSGAVVVDGETYTYVVVGDDVKAKGWSGEPKPMKKAKAVDKS